jgi:hypothetical protein
MLETSTTDEHGRAIHEECYALKINLYKATLPLEDREKREIESKDPLLFPPLGLHSLTASTTDRRPLRALWP